MPEIVTYSRSSYAEIIEDIKFDYGAFEQLMSIPMEELKRWVLLAEKDICEKLPIGDKQELRLLKGVEDYSFADSSSIRGTGTITATGTSIVGVGTKALTELVVGSKISVGGQTRTVVSVTDDLNFTVDSAFTIVVSAQPFTLSPRATEISSEVMRIYDCDRIESGRYLRIKVRDVNYIISMRPRYAYPPTNIQVYIPDVIAPFEDGGRRYLKVFPVPDVDKTIRLWMYLRINPRLHKSDSISDPISLNEMYEPAISLFVQMFISRYLKNVKEESKYKMLYDMEIRTLQLSLPNDGRVEMEYY